MSELRTKFERLHPVPEGIYWQESITNYACDLKHSLATLWNYKHCWQGFQSGHAAGLEDAAKECERPTADGTMYVHYGVRQAAAAIRAMKEPK